MVAYGMNITFTFTLTKFKALFKIRFSHRGKCYSSVFELKEIVSFISERFCLKSIEQCVVVRK